VAVMNKRCRRIGIVLIAIPFAWRFPMAGLPDRPSSCMPAPLRPETSSLAQEQGHGQSKGDDKTKVEKSDHEHRGQGYNRRGANPVFATRERDVISQYFLSRSSELPPGLAKRGGSLPPGLEKHLERGGTLPPGLQKRLTPLPEPLNARLTLLPSFYRRGIIGSNVLIVDVRSWRVVDVMYHVVVH